MTDVTLLYRSRCRMAGGSPIGWQPRRVSGRILSDMKLLSMFRDAREATTLRATVAELELKIASAESVRKLAEDRIAAGNAAIKSARELNEKTVALAAQVRKSAESEAVVAALRLVHEVQSGTADKQAQEALSAHMRQMQSVAAQARNYGYGATNATYGDMFGGLGAALGIMGGYRPH
jgi:hypothetical protein